MTNPYRGEVDIIIDEKKYTAKLTLGSLVELEEKLKDKSIINLIERLEKGVFSSQDILEILVAGLRGGGWDGDSKDLIKSQIDGGFIGAIKKSGELLKNAFSIRE